MRIHSNLALCLLLCAFLTGCKSNPMNIPEGIPSAQMPEQKLSTEEAQEPQKSKPPVPTKDDTPKPVNLTPLSTYTDQWLDGTQNGEEFSDSYTKLLIISELPQTSNGAKIEPLKYNPSNWLWRSIVGKEFSINMTVKVVVGSFESTVPLVTIGHQSNSDGEQWNRVIHHTKMNFPLFLVKSDGTASIPELKISLNGTKSYASRGAAAGLQVALGVARSSALSTSVITKLSEQATKDKARAIDDAISKLFSSGITEEHWTDRDLKAWNIQSGQPTGVKVTFSIPSDEKSWNAEKLEVGSWIFTFDFPRPSIFSDWRICPDTDLPRCKLNRREAQGAVYKAVNASEILSYPLITGEQNLGTIKAFLSQQDWYVAAQAGLADKTGDVAKETAGALCRKISNEITALGLNGFDASIVVWAVAKGMPLPGNTPDMKTIPDCSAVDTIEKARI